MGSHPLNLFLRFLLELTALATIAVWGWHHEPAWQRYVLVIGLPVLAAFVWGVFNVPDDPSRSGEAPVVVPGVLRLVIELAIFGAAVWCLYEMNYPKLGLSMTIIVTFHYLISYDRILWLLRH